MAPTPYLLWNSNQTEIHSIEELDRLIDKVIAEIHDDLSRGIQLVANETTGLLITVGSHL